jgi:O-antigen/teichoic acid export membrane protein
MLRNTRVSVISYISWLRTKQGATIPIEMKVSLRQLLFASLIEMVLFYLPILVLALRGSSGSAGIYAMSIRVVAAPIVLLGVSFARVTTRRALLEISDNLFPSTRGKKIRELLLTPFLVGGIACISIELFARDFLVSIMGKDWSNAVEYIQILAITTCFQVPQYVMSAYMTVNKKTSPTVKTRIVSLSSMSIGLLYLFVFANLNDGISIAICAVASNALGTIYLTRQFFRLIA